MLANEHDPQDEKTPQEEAQKATGQDGPGPRVIRFTKQGADNDDDKSREALNRSEKKREGFGERI